MSFSAVSELAQMWMRERHGGEQLWVAIHRPMHRDGLWVTVEVTHKHGWVWQATHEFSGIEFSNHDSQWWADSLPLVLEELRAQAIEEMEGALYGGEP